MHVSTNVTELRNGDRDTVRCATGASDSWPSAVVFDCDGLLVDTAACWRQAYEEGLRRQGRRLDQEQLAELNGASVQVAARRLDIETDALRAALRHSIGVASASLVPMPGVRDLLTRLRGRVKMAVASNGPLGIVEEVLRCTRLVSYFDAVVSAETVRREKPAPDVYIAACRALAVDPSDAIALEDSPAGAMAARRAGLLVVYVPSLRGAQATCDLEVARLDDARLYSILGVVSERPGHVGGRRALEAVCRQLLDDDEVAAADSGSLDDLARRIEWSLMGWRRQRAATALSGSSAGDSS